MWRDDRGQSIQIGAVILFGALVLALSGYQAFVVPQQNEAVEFSHSQAVEDQLADLRNAIVSVPGDATTRSVSVRLGTRYPARLLAVNPGPATGALRTRGTANATVAFAVEHAVASGETGDVWNGTVRTYPTGWVTYRPDYNVYDGAPTTVYGASVLANEFRSGTVPVTGQTLVDGDLLSLVALNGSLDVARTGAASVDVRPVSASGTTVPVTNETATDPVTLRVPTRLSESTWEELLADESTSAGGHVTDVRTAPLAPPDARLLVVELETGVSYDLQLAKAGVGTRVASESAAYMTDVRGNGSTVPEGGTRQLVVEVRDAYDNPVSGVTVTGSASGGTLASTTATTDADGRATFRYRAPAVTDETDVAVNFSFAVDPGEAPTFDGREPENVDLTVTVQNTQSDDGGGGSGGATYALDWASPTVSEGGPHLSDCDADGCTWDVGADADDTLDLTAATTPEIEDLAVDFALNDSAVATLAPGEDATNSNGEGSTTLTAQENGTVAVYALGTGGARDVLNVTVRNVTGPDTTPPTVSSAEAVHDDNGGPSTTDELRFTVSSADASGIDRIVLTANDAQSGNRIASRTVDSPPSGDLSGEVLDLGEDVNFNGPNGVSVNITVVDGEGNTRTCTGPISNSGGTVSTSGALACDQTSQASIPPVVGPAARDPAAGPSPLAPAVGPPTADPNGEPRPVPLAVGVLVVGAAVADRRRVGGR